jgi:hypothetical protein
MPADCPTQTELRWTQGPKEDATHRLARYSWPSVFESVNACALTVAPAATAVDACRRAAPRTTPALTESKAAAAASAAKRECRKAVMARERKGKPEPPAPRDERRGSGRGHEGRLRAYVARCLLTASPDCAVARGVQARQTGSQLRVMN